MASPRSQIVRGSGLCLVALILCEAGALAQGPTFASPADGYIYDSYSQSIRPVTGFVGSAVLGAPVAGGIDWASIAPNKTSAIIRRDRTLFWIPNLASPDQAQPLNQPAALSVQALWATDSSRVVVLADGEKLVWLNNLTASPSIGASWVVGAARAHLVRGSSVGLISLLAADSFANNVLLEDRTEEGWQIQLASTTLPPTVIPFTGIPAAATFFSSGSAALIADTAAHRIVEVQHLNGFSSPSASAILTSDIYVADPAGIVLSADSTQFFIVDRSTATIRAFDASDGTLLSEIPASVGLSSVTLFDAGRYLLNSSGAPAHSILILNTGTPTQLAFIPRGE